MHASARPSFRLSAHRRAGIRFSHTTHLDPLVQLVHIHLSRLACGAHVAEMFANNEERISGGDPDAIAKLELARSHQAWRFEHVLWILRRGERRSKEMHRSLSSLDRSAR